MDTDAATKKRNSLPAGVAAELSIAVGSKASTSNNDLAGSKQRNGGGAKPVKQKLSPHVSPRPDGTSAMFTTPTATQSRESRELMQFALHTVAR